MKQRQNAILIVVCLSSFFFFLAQDTNHPCTANNPESCTMSLSPQDFINLFNF